LIIKAVIKDLRLFCSERLDLYIDMHNSLLLAEPKKLSPYDKFMNNIYYIDTNIIARTIPHCPYKRQLKWHRGDTIYIHVVPVDWYDWYLKYEKAKVRMQKAENFVSKLSSTPENSYIEINAEEYYEIFSYN